MTGSSAGGRRVMWVAACAVVASLSCALQANARSEADFQHADLKAWVAANAEAVAQHAVPLRTLGLEADDSDLRVLDEVLRPEVRVIGFGEAAHGVREFLVLRNRLFAYLVEHHGVTAYAAETSFTRAAAIDRYLVAGGELTDEMIDSAYIAVPATFPYAIALDMPGRAGEVMRRWPEISKWVRPENRELVEWMREYNTRATTKRPVRFYGVSPCPQSWPDAWGEWTKNGCIGPAIGAALDYIETVDYPAAEALRKRLEVYLPVYMPEGAGGYVGKMPREDEADRFVVAIEDLVRVFVQRYVLWVGKTSSYDFHEAYRNAIVARQIVNDTRLGQIKVPGDGIFPGLGASSDSGASENVLWALAREGQQGRVFLFYHNTHLDKRSTANVGRYLKEVLGDQLYLVASDGSFGVGRAGYVPEANRIFSTLKSPLFFLDLKEVSTWRPEGRGTSEIQKSYDSMMFIKSLQRHSP